MPIERCTETDLCTELQRHLVEPGQNGPQVAGVEKTRGRRTHALAVCERRADKVTILTSCPHCGASLRDLRGWMQDAGAAKPKAFKP